MPKICIALTSICFSLLVLANWSKAWQDSNSRYLLVEVDGTPDIDQGRDVTTDETALSELEGEPTYDLEPLPEGDEEDADPQGGKRSSNLNNFYNTYFLAFRFIILATQNKVKMLNFVLQTLEGGQE